MVLAATLGEVQGGVVECVGDMPGAGSSADRRSGRSSTGCASVDNGFIVGRIIGDDDNLGSSDDNDVAVSCGASDSDDNARNYALFTNDIRGGRIRCSITHGDLVGTGSRVADSTSGRGHVGCGAVRGALVECVATG